MEYYTYLRNVTDLLTDGKTPYERRLGQPFQGPIIPFGSFFEYHPKTAKGSVKNPSIWKESLTWDCSSDTLCTRGEFGRVDVLIADLEELETMDASGIYSKRLNAKEVIFSQTRRIYFSNRRWTNQNPREETRN